MIEQNSKITKEKLSNDVLSISPENFPNQVSFIETVTATADLLESVGITSEETMIISGGSVGLRQMELGISDRVPTDLDMVINYSSVEQANNTLSIILEQLKKNSEFTNTKLITEPRTHWNYIFTNPILETVYSNNGTRAFPVDFLTRMTTVFPNTAYIPRLRGVSYNFPIKDIMFENSKEIQVGSKKVRVAHPAFATIYKVTMNRNGENPDICSCPKQDDQDLMRMVQLGLIDLDDKIFREILETMAWNDLELADQLLEGIATKINNFSKKNVSTTS